MGTGSNVAGWKREGGGCLSGIVHCDFADVVQETWLQSKIRRSLADRLVLALGWGEVVLGVLLGATTKLNS